MKSENKSRIQIHKIQLVHLYSFFQLQINYEKPIYFRILSYIVLKCTTKPTLFNNYKAFYMFPGETDFSIMKLFIHNCIVLDTNKCAEFDVHLLYKTRNGNSYVWI